MSKAIYSAVLLSSLATVSALNVTVRDRGNTGTVSEIEEMPAHESRDLRVLFKQWRTWVEVGSNGRAVRSYWAAGSKGLVLRRELFNVRFSAAQLVVHVMFNTTALGEGVG
jgi:hypothetical protein